MNIGEFLSGASGLLGSVAAPAIGVGSVMNAYNRLGTIGERAQQGAQLIANQGLEQTQFRPFTVRSATGGMFGYDPTTGQANIGLSPTEQNIQNQLLSQAQQGFGATPTGLSQLQQAGLAASAFGQGALGQTPGSSLFNLGASQLGMTPGTQAMTLGQQALGQTPYGLGSTQQAAQQAFGLGSQFMGASQYQPADINALRGQFAGQVGGMLTQQPSSQIGQLGSQALSLGQQGLQTVAPSDVEALRSQYGSLASQAASTALQDTAGREADVYNRIRATQRPEEERQRMALEERLASQGRLGVRTNLYGGTPEQAALAQAQEEAQNRASLAAIQQAQSERQQALGEAQTFGGLFGQQAGLSSQLQSQAQARAAQLAQLGLSAEQIESQLQSEGLGRAATSASQAAQLAQLAGGLQAQQAGLGAQFAGLGSSLTGQGQALSAAQQAQALQALQAGQGMNLAQQQAAQAALQGGQGLNLAQQQQALAALQAGQGLFGGALGLQGAQQQLAQSALANAYMPQAQLLNAQTAAQLFPQLQQRGQLAGAGLFGEASISGLEALLGSGIGQANLMGDLGTGLLGSLATPTANYGGLPEVFTDIYNAGRDFLGFGN